MHAAQVGTQFQADIALQLAEVLARRSDPKERLAIHDGVYKKQYTPSMPVHPTEMVGSCITPQLTCERVKQNASAASFLVSLVRFSARYASYKRGSVLDGVEIAGLTERAREHKDARHLSKLEYTIETESR